ncbi:MAG: hypothetical protein ACYCT1_06745 [Steroidobacteraceae bacterium]
MTRSHLRAACAASALGLSLALGGCVVAPPGRYYGPVAVVAPPPPRVEYYGAPPYPGYFWIGGYWRWAPRGYLWVRGHWAAPRPGLHWMPRRWVRGRRGWHLAGGHWARDRH